MEGLDRNMVSRMLTISATDSSNGAFVIGSGAILGIGASFLWIVQGAIMTTYVAESQKDVPSPPSGSSSTLAAAWARLASFGLNFHSRAAPCRTRPTSP